MPKSLPKPKPKPTATVPATTFPKFRELADELQLMIWKAYLETKPTVRHCFTKRQFGYTYALVDPLQNTLRPVVPASPGHPNRHWVDPGLLILEQHKVFLPGTQYLARPTTTQAEIWNVPSINLWTKAQSPLYTYVNFQTDIFYLDLLTGFGKKRPGGAEVVCRFEYDWIWRAQHIALRMPLNSPSSIHARLCFRAAFNAGFELAPLAKDLRVLYFVISREWTLCPLGPPSSWLTGAAAAAAAATGFIDYRQFSHAHTAELNSRWKSIGPQGKCTCLDSPRKPNLYNFLHEPEGGGWVGYIRSRCHAARLPPHVKVRVVVDTMG